MQFIRFLVSFIMSAAYFIRFSYGRKLNKKCCYNGGTCFLGSFCICAKQYTGRQCEYERWPLDCPGGILNGEWVVRGCLLCRCFSGELHCLPSVPECEEESQAFRSAGSSPKQKWIVLIVTVLLFNVL